MDFVTGIPSYEETEHEIVRVVRYVNWLVLTITLGASDDDPGEDWGGVVLASA